MGAQSGLYDLVGVLCFPGALGEGCRGWSRWTGRVGKSYQGQSLNFRDGRDLGQRHTGPSSLQKDKRRRKEREKSDQDSPVKHHLHRSSHPSLGQERELGFGRWSG